MKKAKAPQQQMFSWLNPKLEVRETSITEKGVFTKDIIKKGEKLAIFGGYILTIEEEADLDKNNSDTGLQITEEFVLTSKDHKEKTDYFNHSCNPNAGFSDQIILSALSAIGTNTQITFDYAMTLYAKDNYSKYTLACNCGFKNCRKVITSEDWKRPDLQKKYNGFFQPYIQRKINKKNK